MKNHVGFRFAEQGLQFGAVAYIADMVGEQLRDLFGNHRFLYMDLAVGRGHRVSIADAVVSEPLAVMTAPIAPPPPPAPMPLQPAAIAPVIGAPIGVPPRKMMA